jgi:hypothetical protein
MNVKWYAGKTRIPNAGGFIRLVSAREYRMLFPFRKTGFDFDALAMQPVQDGHRYYVAMFGTEARPITWQTVTATEGKARFNCGVGPGGFKPGNTCGGEEGGGSAKGSGSAKPKGSAAQGIEDRARASGRTFTEQYLHETRSKIDRDYETRKAADARRADARVKKAETRLAETKARGPQPAAAQSPRMAEISGNIADLEARLAEVRKTGDAARARAAAIAKEQEASAQRTADAKRRLEESKARSRALSRALRGL